MHISDELLDEAVNAMEQEFDSHEVIKHLMRRHPQEYVRHLYFFVDHQDPIRDGHAAIGRKLATFTTIEKTDRPVTANIRGGENDNQGWRKK